jgi:uncharacterized protein (DUF1778 family)
VRDQARRNSADGPGRSRTPADETEIETDGGDILVRRVLCPEVLGYHVFGRGAVLGMTVGVKRQAPLKIDPATDELISQAAHFLGMTKKDFVAEAAKAYLEQRREEVRRGMIESMKLLDNSLTSTVATLTGLSPERIEELGGTGDWEG